MLPNMILDASWTMPLIMVNLTLNWPFNRFSYSKDNHEIHAVSEQVQLKDGIVFMLHCSFFV